MSMKELRADEVVNEESGAAVEEPVAPEAEEYEAETETEEDIDFTEFEFTDQDFSEEEEQEGEASADEDAPEEDTEEGEEPETPEEDEETEEDEPTIDYRAELEKEQQRKQELLNKLGYKDEDEAIAHTEGVTVEEYRAKRAKAEESFKAWEEEDIGEISKVYPELKGKSLNEALEDPTRFASLRGDAQMRQKMSAVEAYEFVNRNKLKSKAEATGAQKAASKAHLKSTKKRSVAPPTAIPRQVVQMLSDAGMTKEEIAKYTTPFLS